MKYNCYITYEDERYPILIVEGEGFGAVGYSLNASTGELDRICICSAHSSSECLCGAWDND